jgi:hypothetical protein
MTREEFRENVLLRDDGLCVICYPSVVTAADVHHIMERRLFDDGGYDVDNGASLCSEHHILAEKTALSCEDIRLSAGIKRIVLPPHLYDDQVYDKWGNIINEDGTRLRGELFFDPSVQKALHDVLHTFRSHVKYPRTLHLPWSNPSSDDKMMEDLSGLIGQEVVVTLKLDGENMSCYRDRIHARSTEPAMGDDRARAKSIHGMIAHEIPEGWRICGENVYAKHSIHYHHLKAWFYVFGIWDDLNRCLSWDETIEWCELLDLMHVPVLYRGVWDESIIRGLQQAMHGKDEMEGIVVRVTRGFPYGEFRKVVAKYVRAEHVKSDRHWRHQMVIPNDLG